MAYDPQSLEAFDKIQTQVEEWNSLVYLRVHLSLQWPCEAQKSSVLFQLETRNALGVWGWFGGSVVAQTREAGNDRQGKEFMEEVILGRSVVGFG